VLVRTLNGHVLVRFHPVVPINRPPVPRYRYFIFVLVMLMALLNFIDRGAIVHALSGITHKYGFDNGVWGAVPGYFGCGYIFGASRGHPVGSFPTQTGLVRCRRCVRTLFEITTVFAGHVGIALLGVSAMTGFATIRVWFGFAEDPAHSAIHKNVANWATPNERGRVISRGLLSMPLGAMSRTLHRRS